MIRITKTEARKIYNEGGEVYIVASKLRDEFAMKFNKAVSDIVNTSATFESWVNAYKYYNCNTETGNGVRFYKD